MKKILLALLLLTSVNVWAYQPTNNVNITGGTISGTTLTDIDQAQYSEISVVSGAFTYVAQAPVGSSATTAVWRCYMIDGIGDIKWYVPSSSATSAFVCTPGTSGASLSGYTYNW